MAVSLTLLGRGESAVVAEHDDLVNNVHQFDAEDFDGIATALNYNMINRVSNGFAISPEWSSWRRPAWLLRLSRRPAAWLLRQALSFDNFESHGESDEWLTRLRARLESGGLGPLPDDYGQIAKAPHLAEALCHLFAASTDGASVDDATLRAIDRAVLLQLGADRLLPPIAAGADAPRDAVDLAADERSNACRTFAERSTTRPWSISADEIGKLRTCGFSEAEILDVVFRIAVLNGLGRLDRLFSARADYGNDGS